MADEVKALEREVASPLEVRRREARDLLDLYRAKLIEDLTLAIRESPRTRP
ncbi:hypothetical protein [Sphingobium sp. 15-1]|uniref:hypothetical protein n=1 Tax=Sphingobium sp. 15-1 TaxID=2729616 RepID=UPI001C3FDBB0|nr:hypothetical protein [Sphingobium sp. 15-1]